MYEIESEIEENHKAHMKVQRKRAIKVRETVAEKREKTYGNSAEISSEHFDGLFENIEIYDITITNKKKDE